MSHRISIADRTFQHDFETGQFQSDLGHREHLQLAYIYLADHEISQATKLVRGAIHNFLRYRAIDFSHYHETLTRAWMMAVRHFMERTPPTDSFDRFIECNSRLLDSKIMLTHYSSSLLYSDRARASFVEPDLDLIPSYPG